MDIPHKNASLREWIEWLSEPTPTPSNAYFMALQFRDRMAWACPAIEDAARAASATDVAQAKPFAELSFLAWDSASQEEPAGNLFLPLILSGALWAEPCGANELLMLLFKNPALGAIGLGLQGHEGLLLLVGGLLQIEAVEGGVVDVPAMPRQGPARGSEAGRWPWIARSRLCSLGFAS